MNRKWPKLPYTPEKDIVRIDRESHRFGDGSYLQNVSIETFDGVTGKFVDQLVRVSADIKSMSIIPDSGLWLSAWGTNRAYLSCSHSMRILDEWGHTASTWFRTEPEYWLYTAGSGLGPVYALASIHDGMVRCVTVTPSGKSYDWGVEYPWVASRFASPDFAGLTYEGYVVMVDGTSFHVYDSCGSLKQYSAYDATYLSVQLHYDASGGYFSGLTHLDKNFHADWTLNGAADAALDDISVPNGDFVFQVGQKIGHLQSRYDSPRVFRLLDRRGHPQEFPLTGEFDEFYIDNDFAAFALPHGGFALATSDALHAFNARGSDSCQGCGPPAPDCSDDDACTTDSCDPNLGDCVHIPVPGCTKPAGICFTAADCDDADPCTADTCVAKTGACLHDPQPTCLTGNRCVAATGVCTKGVCIPDAPPKSTGWVLPVDCDFPRLFEAKGGEVLVACGWYALRVSSKGVVKWRRILDGAIAGASGTPDDGLMLTILQKEGQELPGHTRMLKLSADGKQVLDQTVATGFEDWWPGRAEAERQSLLAARPQGGYALLGRTTWSGDAWHGRLVQLSAAAAVTLAADVTLTGVEPAPFPSQQGLWRLWPQSDGTVLVAWAGGTPTRWRVAHVAADGKVLWNQEVAQAVNGGFAAFDPLLPLVATNVPGKPDVAGLFQIGAQDGKLSPLETLDKTYFGLTGLAVPAFAAHPGGKRIVRAGTWYFGGPAWQIDMAVSDPTPPPRAVLDAYVFSTNRIYLVGHTRPTAVFAIDDEGEWIRCQALP